MDTDTIATLFVIIYFSLALVTLLLHDRLPSRRTNAFLFILWLFFFIIAFAIAFAIGATR